MAIEKIVKHWQYITSLANAHYDNQAFNKALTEYQNALHFAELLNNSFLENRDTDIPYVHIYTISCNNLANTYLHLERVERAEKMYKRAFCFLLYIRDTKSIHPQQLAQEIHQSGIELISFWKNNLDANTIEQKMSWLEDMLSKSTSPYSPIVY